MTTTTAAYPAALSGVQGFLAFLTLRDVPLAETLLMSMKLVSRMSVLTLSAMASMSSSAEPERILAAKSTPRLMWIWAVLTWSRLDCEVGS